MFRQYADVNLFTILLGLGFWLCGGVIGNEFRQWLNSQQKWRFCQPRYLITIELFCLFASFFAIYPEITALLLMIVGFTEQVNEQNSNLHSRTVLPITALSFGISCAISVPLIIAIVVLIWTFQWNDKVIPEPIVLKRPTFTSSILALSSGLTLGITWMIVSSALGITSFDHALFYGAIFLTTFCASKNDTPLFSAIAFIPIALFCFLGIGLMYGQLRTILGPEPWAYLNLLPAFLGLFIGSLGSLTTHQHPSINRIYLLGFCIAGFTSSDWNPVWIIILFIFWGCILSKNIRVQYLMGGYLLALFGFGLNTAQIDGAFPWMKPIHISQQSNEQDFPDHHWSIWGNHVLSAKEGVSFFVNEVDTLHGWSNSFRISTVGRLASAEYFAGHLATFVSPDLAQVTILGDFSANLLSAFDGNTTQTHFHSPDVWLTRWLADFSEPRERQLLKPEVILLPKDRTEILRSIPDQDLLLEIIHTPWDTAVQSRPDERFFSHRAKAIKGSGLAIFILHTTNWPDSSPQHVISSIQSSFAHTQLWLPPKGADSLIVLAANEPFDFVRYHDKLKRFSNHPLLREGAVSVLAHAIGGTERIKTWAQYADVKKYWHPSDTPSLPVLHLSNFNNFETDSTKIWSNPPAEFLDELNYHLESRNRFIAILSKASEGKIQDVFLQASELLDGEPWSSEAILTLVDPHLRDAKIAIQIAREEGQDSSSWLEGSRFATTANMLIPNSPEPLCLLGEVNIGQGNIEQAEIHFKLALEHAPTSLAALDGLARVSGLQNDQIGIEKWLGLALQYHPDIWNTHYNLGSFLKLNERYDEAESRFRKSITLSKDTSPLPHNQLAEIYLDTEQPTRALIEIEKSIQIDATAMGWFIRGRAYFDLKQWDKAEDDFRRATLSDPNLHDARGAVGLVKIAQGEFEAAAQTFRAVLRFDPGNQTALINLRQVEAEIAAQGQSPTSP